jgi:hypothetical protein
MNKEYLKGTKVQIIVHTFSCIHLLACICLHAFACLHSLLQMTTVSDAIDAQ